jgi:transcriptional regulator
VIIRNKKQVFELMAYAQIAQAPHDVLDELVAAVVADLDEDDVDVEFETRELSERIDFLVHVLGPAEADEAVRAAIDGELVLDDVGDDED